MKAHITLTTAIIITFFLVIAGNAQDKNTETLAQNAVKDGWTSFNKGELETALQHFQQATTIDPEFAPGYYGKAYVYGFQNNLDSAIENYRKTIELADPPLNHAYGNLGLALLMKGEKEEGHEMLLKALELDPNAGGTHVNLAQSYCDRKDNIKVWEHIQKARDLNTDIPQEILDGMQSKCPEPKQKNL